LSQKSADVTMGGIRSTQSIVASARESFEVVVIGGGPGGATAAGLLARAGRRVLVLEREAFPRFHVGESLLPRSIEVLEQLGVMPKIEAEFLRKYGARFIDSDTGAENRFSFGDAIHAHSPYAFQVPRDRFDQVLLDHAVELGAEARHRWQVARMLFDGGRATGVVARDPDGHEHVIDASCTIDATGRDALRAHAQRSQQKLPMLDRTMAVFSQFRGVPRPEGVEAGDIRIVVAQSSWFWVIPFRDGRTSVGAVLDASEIVRAEGRATPAATFAALCEASPPMRRLLEGATPLFDVRAAADFSYRVSDIIGDGWLALGDASGFVDPLFSTGVHLALRGAMIAAPLVDQALAAGDVGRARFLAYERSQRRAVEIFIGAVQAFYDRRLVPLLFAPEQRPLMRALITSILGGDTYHADEPLWVREFARRYPAKLGVGAGASPVTPGP
jgi:flavin-dependent dehydrogenase